MLENQIPPTPVLIKDLGMMYATETSKQKTRFGLYKCSCGKEFKANSCSVNYSRVNSCGCYKKKRVLETNIKHGLSSHTIYKTWNDMMQRVYNKNHKYFSSYGERGITVCKEWKDPSVFIKDMLPQWSKGLSFDRIDNNGNYEPSNCRWTSKAVQARNTRIISKNNTSGYRGVHFNNAKKKWIAKIKLMNVSKHLGCFESAIDAAIAYDNYVISNKLEHTINGV